jgi:hypothetical protein
MVGSHSTSTPLATSNIQALSAASETPPPYSKVGRELDHSNQRLGFNNFTPNQHPVRHISSGTIEPDMAEEAEDGAPEWIRMNILHEAYFHGVVELIRTTLLFRIFICFAIYISASAVDLARLLYMLSIACWREEVVAPRILGMLSRAGLLCLLFWALATSGQYRSELK